ncbi:MAG: DNA-binding protein [Clostridia bacterium]|nr:MAG: DNA-binding protein [Clostridia bacterium]
MEKAWISVQEAAQYLGVARPTIYRWARQGRLPIYKLAGGVTRVKVQDLEKLLMEAQPLYNVAGPQNRDLRQQRSPEKEAITEYCRRHGEGRANLRRARDILGRLPFSLSENVRRVREES